MSTAGPNILFILTDDQATWALGCGGNSEIRTPNLDALAARGVRFSNFFCASPVCSAARASILTGRIPSQHGVHDWIMGGNSEDDFGRSGVREPIEYLAGISGYTDVLASAGYTCGMIGKWHLGFSRRPQKSFAHWYVFKNVKGYRSNTMIRNGKEEPVTEYVTDVLTREALSFLERAHGEQAPFYLSVHYNAPHAPWIDQHPQDLVDSYDDSRFLSCPQEPTHPWAKGKGERPAMDARENLKGYFAAVTAMDRGVGAIVEKLDELGIRENTLICFMSDNGMNLGHHGIWGKGNGTFPQNMYETSVKVPAIFSMPGRIPEGRVCEDLASQYDVRPTLLEFAGLDNPEAQTLPGRSFLPSLLGQTASARREIVVFDEYGPVRMIRDSRYKYIHRYPYGPHELYDLEEDPGERRNLVDDPAQTERIVEMRHRLIDWFHRYADPQRDGTMYDITGDGQRGPVGAESRFKDPFTHKKPVKRPEMEQQFSWW
jgi:arylsulfatase A-like enzyme